MFVPSLSLVNCSCFNQKVVDKTRKVFLSCLATARRHHSSSPPRYACIKRLLSQLFPRLSRACLGKWSISRMPQNRAPKGPFWGQKRRFPHRSACVRKPRRSNLSPSCEPGRKQPGRRCVLGTSAVQPPSSGMSHRATKT